MRVVIPAAGLGTRFAAERLGIPKELLPLGGTTVIGHAIAEAARAGFDAVTVVLSPAKQQLRLFLANNEFPLAVDTVVQPQALGLGDAVLRSWRGEPVALLLPDDVVLSTDHWLSILAMHRRYAAAVLCLRLVPFETISRFGIADCKGTRVVGLVEKPQPGASDSNLAIFGRYVVTEQVIAGLRGLSVTGELELTEGFAAAIVTPTGVRAVRFRGESYDCGTPDEYASSLARFPGRPAN